jgi:hypothetical protein
MSEYRKYLLEYYYGGKNWLFKLDAVSAEDAEARCRAISYRAKVLGESGGSVPATLGSWLPRLVCWWQNRGAR